MGASHRVDGPSRKLARGCAPSRRAARGGRGFRRRELGALRSSMSTTSNVRRSPQAPGRATCPARSVEAAAPSRPICATAPGVLSADGGRDGGDPPRRGRNREGRGSREDRHLPLRGGQGPRSHGAPGAATGSRLGLGVGARDAGESFWLRDDPSRRSAWLLVADAARLGLAIEPPATLDAAGGHGPRRWNGTPRAVPPVDRAHRHMEQRRAALSTRRSPSSNHFVRTSTGCGRSGATGPTAGRWTSTPSARRGFLPTRGSSSGRSSTRS